MLFTVPPISDSLLPGRGFGESKSPMSFGSDVVPGPDKIFVTGSGADVEALLDSASADAGVALFVVAAAGAGLAADGAGLVGASGAAAVGCATRVSGAAGAGTTGVAAVLF
jgi:hypothetical protein